MLDYIRAVSSGTFCRYAAGRSRSSRVKPRLFKLALAAPVGLTPAGEIYLRKESQGWLPEPMHRQPLGNTRALRGGVGQ